MDVSPISPMANQAEPNAGRNKYKEVAVALEASFLAEMLKYSGHGESRSSFGGGEGEDAFAGLLVREQATLMAESGGIGLAEQIIDSMMRRAENV
ncbi:hypothetical protein A9Q96_11050 [Rhodobacterales bacterium 52_120_T64]|nr:hypothetical protein A9Q96_11050 [Rhodobacterales bacterium 52_120_T64]